MPLAAPPDFLDLCCRKEWDFFRIMGCLYKNTLENGFLKEALKKCSLLLDAAQQVKVMMIPIVHPCGYPDGLVVV
jgi:hypothetical protein